MLTPPPSAASCACVCAYKQACAVAVRPARAGGAGRGRAGQCGPCSEGALYRSMLLAQLAAAGWRRRRRPLRPFPLHGPPSAAPLLSRRRSPLRRVPAGAGQPEDGPVVRAAVHLRTAGRRRARRRRRRRRRRGIRALCAALRPQVGCPLEPFLQRCPALLAWPPS